MDISQLLNSISEKYSNNENYGELEGELNAIQKHGVSFYELKRIGYHLCEIFNDKTLSKNAFEKALELCEDDEDVKDVIDDITFLSLEWAEELRNIYGLSHDED